RMEKVGLEVGLMLVVIRRRVVVVVVEVLGPTGRLCSVLLEGKVTSGVEVSSVVSGCVTKVRLVVVSGPVAMVMSGVVWRSVVTWLVVVVRVLVRPLALLLTFFTCLVTF